MDNIKEQLKKNIDTDYAVFQRKLIPDIPGEKIMGIRTPILKKIAKNMSGSKEAEEFMDVLPHNFFEEDQLHAFLISGIKDVDVCIKRYKEFVPYIDNWATCDQLSPKAFKKHPEKALELTEEYIASGQTYIIRTGIGILMRYYLDDLFEPVYLKTVSGIQSEEYYVNMMRAWYFATALAKHYEVTVEVLKNNELDRWTHNKTIQKAVESFRISDEQKTYLKTLRLK